MFINWHQSRKTLFPLLKPWLKYVKLQVLPFAGTRCCGKICQYKVFHFNTQSQHWCQDKLVLNNCCNISCPVSLKFVFWFVCTHQKMLE